MKRVEGSLLLLALLVFPFFFIGGFGPYAPRSWVELWNIGHIIFFALAGYLLITTVPFVKHKSFYQQLFYSFMLSFISGVLIELIQYGTLRDADFLDVVRGVVGALMAVAWLSSKVRTIAGYQLLLIRFLLAFMLFLQCCSVFFLYWGERSVAAFFPVLADFNSTYELDNWTGGNKLSLSDEQAYQGQYSLKLGLDPGFYSGATLKYMVRDWRGYTNFFVAVYNPSADMLALTIRIDDLQHKASEQLYGDRFNKSFLLVQGWNPIAINLQEVADAPNLRTMDMSAIATVGFFTSRLKEPKIIFIDNIHLK